MHYYQFNIGDYSASTQHLDPMEDIAYRRMLDLYYSKESPLPESVESIARLIRMRTHCECIALVLQEFFELKNGSWHNHGADKVLDKTYSKSDKARAAANKRWNKNKELPSDADAMQTHSKRNADGMLPNTQYPVPNTQDKDISAQNKNIDRSSASIGGKNSAKQELISDTFEHWWKLFPTKLGKKKASSIWNNICKKKTEDQIADLTDTISVNIVDQIEKEVFGFDRLHPTTYLNQERWTDELPS